MVIPKQLNIGGFIIEVRLVADLNNDGTLEDGLIQINNGLDQKLKELTLLHEIIHCINPAIPEKDVEYLSRALYQVYSDNYVKGRKK